MRRTTSLMSIISLIVVALFSSCNSSTPDYVSSKEILKQFNQHLKENAIDRNVVVLTTGMYECNNSTQREMLRQLQAAELITYQVERYPWWEKSYYSGRESYQVTKYFWGYPYTDTHYRYVKKVQYNFEDHYVVNIALTPKGEKMLVEELPTPEPKLDKDLIGKPENTEKYKWNNVDLTENWEDIPNPFIEPEPAKEEAAKEDDSKPETTVAEEKKVSDSKEEEIERRDIKFYHGFNALELNPEEKMLAGYKLKGIKARNIQIKNIDGITTATAEVIVATYDVTDAARIINGMQNDRRILNKVTLNYYCDKGWVLTNIEETPEAIASDFSDLL